MAAVAFIDTDGHPHAEDFYRIFPHEPVLPTGTLRIAKRIPIRRMTAVRLLQQMRRYARGHDALIVVHGNHTGLDIPLHDKAQPLNLDSLEVIKRNLSGKLPDEEAGESLGLSQPKLIELKIAIEAVHRLHLKRVEFRACSVGQETLADINALSGSGRSKFGDILRDLKEFFGAKNASGPREIDFFTRVTLGRFASDPTTWQTWLDDHPTAVIDPPGGLVPNRVGWSVEQAFPYSMAILADSSPALGRWIQRKLGALKRTRRHLFIHALLQSHSC